MFRVKAVPLVPGSVTIPNEFSKREDLLPATIIEPLNPGSCPSPPTSRLVDLIEDLDIMYSRAAHSFSRAPSLEEEGTGDDLGRYFPRRQQGIEISESEFELEDEDEEYEDGTEERRPSKYDVKPPARLSVQPRDATASTHSTPRSVYRSSKIQHSQQATPTGARSPISTPRRSEASRFRGSGRSLPSRAPPTPEFSLPEDIVAAAKDDLYDENNAEDTKGSAFVERNLRKRTLQQTKPDKFDKHRYNLSRKTGHEANPKKVEKAIQDEIGVREHKQTKKKPRGSSRNSTKSKAKTSTPREQTADKRRLSNSAGSVSPSPETDSEHVFDPARTTLRVCLDGFHGGAAIPIPLNECDSNDKRVDSILKFWGWKFTGTGFSYAIVSFPWLTEQSNILLRPGLPESFKGMRAEIENAPIRAEGRHERCDVQVTVYQQQ
ncbi:uncharacterized protein Z519_08988 [Cladophialophora bantiana CBS 173.52]|uniref:Uncharacterized protein n=1 Tax=Cladophialophora bantiana (strain ATCC 10958 / CBS 173.52 / CDC B-1940 / NIH 8579) TaxID=1442370 RepID=A0A0D2I0F1_CLAB1|nr:uncharacterized protein Z519_08988 [Cladophialophora bantiana CBS 173.52]KIW90344.1 hypothetical protein Z519_08988 [Cladophialophora bantiana CBS 173.52]